MNERKGFDFKRFKEEAMESLYQGKKMGGNDGVLAPMLKHQWESMLEGELDIHYRGESKSSAKSNCKNGKTTRTVRSLQLGNFELGSKRGRHGIFEPKIVSKWQLNISEVLGINVIFMYAKGMSARNISDCIQEMSALNISVTEVLNITDRVIPALKEWKNRPLEAAYPFVLLDCINFKVCVSGGVESRAVYNILTDLKQRGVEDILETCIDCFKGIPESIEAVFPKNQIQIYIVHQLRVNLSYVPVKDKKAVFADLKPIYKANNQKQGYEKSLVFENKWGNKYPIFMKDGRKIGPFIHLFRLHCRYQRGDLLH